MKKFLFPMMLAVAATVCADGYVTVDDFGGVTGDTGFWNVSAHPERKAHVRTVAVPFDLAVAQAVGQTFDVFDSRVCTAVFGELLGEFSSLPPGLMLMLR